MIFKCQNCVLGMHSTQKQDWATCTTKDKWKKPENFTLLGIPQLHPRISMVCSFYLFIYLFSAFFLCLLLKLLQLYGQYIAMLY